MGLFKFAGLVQEALAMHVPWNFCITLAIRRTSSGTDFWSIFSMTLMTVFENFRLESKYLLINYYAKHEGLWQLIMLSELVLPQVDQPLPCPTFSMGLVKARYRQYFCTANSIKHLRQSTLFFPNKTQV